MKRGLILALSIGAALPLVAYVSSNLFAEPSAARPFPKGCQSYIEVDNPLIAHAGGGLPTASLTNSREAIDIAYQNGIRLLEIDFEERDEGFVIGHDGFEASDLTLSELVTWLESHHGAMIVTDVKSDNLSGLARIRDAAGDAQNRFIPQIYSLNEYDDVVGLGFKRPIFTAYRLDLGDLWIDDVNSLDLTAVTLPVLHKGLAEFIEHPVYLHTVNEPMPDFGLYTDCLVPRSGKG